jgi:hypothetical protein
MSRLGAIAAASMMPRSFRMSACSAHSIRLPSIKPALTSVTKKKKTILRTPNLGDRVKKGAKLTGHVFHDDEPETDPDSAILHGEEIGLGSRSYELISVK